MTLPLPPVRPRPPAPPALEHMRAGDRVYFLLATIASAGASALMWAYAEWDTHLYNRRELARYTAQLVQYDYDLHQYRTAQPKDTR